MLNTFRAFDPATILSKSNSTACEQCYARKVKCEALPDNKSTCKQCADHGVECIARTRKRKASSLGDGNREQDSSNASGSSSSKPATELPEASNMASRRRQSALSASKPPRMVQKSSSMSVPELFVSRDAAVDYSPGSSEQTETPAQDRFRNASYISRSAILGNDFQDIDHAHPERTAVEEKISTVEMKTLKLHGAFDLPNPALRQSLVEAYIERCYTWMPVVDLATFNSAGQGPDSSILLLQAVLLVGALMRPDVCTKAFCDRQYVRVKALILSGHERHPLNILAALCLIQWYTPTAPKDISTDVPRFWNTYAVGLAQQMGLQRGSSGHADANLRNRIWWTMVTRDNLTASAHGRPRIIQPEDCTGPEASIDDFGNPERSGLRANIWAQHAHVVRILGDLCLCITRKGEASPEDKEDIAIRLNVFLQNLPDELRLYNPNGLPQSYNFDIAQLHIPILMAVMILFRPRTVYQLSAANSGSATAAFLSYRVFQAIQLREHTRYLSSAFAWYLLVTAIPLLSCSKVPGLRNDANEALDSVENVLETLGRVRPAAANNLRSVRAIRKAMETNSNGAGGTTNAASNEEQGSGFQYQASQLLQTYGLDSMQQHEQIAEVLAEHHRGQAERNVQAAAHTLSCLSGGQDPNPNRNGYFSPGTDAYLHMTMAEQDLQNAFTAVFEDDTLSTSWMMRDWLDELQS